MDDHEHPPTRTEDATPLGAFLLEPDEDAPDARPGTRRRIRAGAIVLAVAVVAAGALAVAFGPTAWDVLRERNSRIDRPDRIEGLTLDRSQGAQDTADYLRTAVSAGVPLDKTVGAVYVQDEDTAHSVIFFGGTGLLLQPDKQLSHAFGLITDQTGGVSEVVTKPAGSLGGTVKCGTTPTDDGTMAVCGWADHGSLALALFPGRGVDESAALLLRMRGAMQHRG
jgi:hypothetical protein